MKISRNAWTCLICVGLLIVGSIVFGVVWVSHGEYRFRIAKKNFGSVRIGDTRDAVISRLGKPNNHDGECYADFGPPKECASELIYSDPSDLLMGNLYIVDFSRQGRVIATRHIH